MLQKKTTPSLTTALAILQQSEYDHAEFLRWWQKHESNSTIQIEPDKWTPKLTLVRTIAQGFFFLSIPARLRIATALLGIPESGVKNYTIHKAKLKLRKAQKNGLIVVAIAGSYAKTSTKHWLNHLLKSQINILSTQKSINTPLGIAHTIETELTADHQVFIVELGEYYPGDIAQLAHLIQPDFGILTPVGRQHLSRMKSVETIAQTIGELLEYFEQKNAKSDTSQQKPLPIISAIENQPYFGNRVDYYGIKQKSNSTPMPWSISKAKVTRAGTEVEIKSADNEVFSFFTPLYGAHQCSNALPAFWLANSINTLEEPISLKKVAQSAATMPYIYQRHEPHFAANDVLILDNSYNTNPEAFDASLNLLAELKPSRSIVITLGFVELGDSAQSIHTELGKTLAESVDYLGIIESDQAQTIYDSFIAHGGKADHIVREQTPEACMSALQKYVIPGSIILFEGGYREVLV